MSIHLFIILAIVIGLITVFIFNHTDDLKVLPVSMLFLLSLLAYYIMSNHIDVRHNGLLFIGIIWILCVILLAARIFFEFLETPIDNEDNNSDWHM